MNSLWFYSDPIDRLHQLGLSISKNKPWLAADYRFVEWSALDEIQTILTGRGYRVSRTKANSPFDLWVEGVRVEAKAARWHECMQGGRYQAAIRNHQADLLIFDCINGAHHLHVIPMTAIGAVKSIAVWSYDPTRSKGRWAQFLDAWAELDKAIDAANFVWQLPLF